MRNSQFEDWIGVRLQWKPLQRISSRITVDLGLRPKMISFGDRIRSLNVEGFMDFKNPICIIGIFEG